MVGIVIASAFLLLILLILFLPVNLFLAFDNHFSFSVKLSFFRLFSSVEPSSEKQEAREETEVPKEEKKKNKDSLLRQLFRKKGMTEGAKELLTFAGKVLRSLKRFLKHITFHHICLKLAVADEDAARTAILYGEICSAVYPCLSFLDQASNVKYKDISISTDFAASEIKPEFFAVISTRVFFLLVSAARVFIEFLSFRKQVQKQ